MELNTKLESSSRVELLRKYNVPGPRYTSYPTVPYWRDSPTQVQWVEALASGFSQENPLGGALYIHIPFCKSLCTYCGCNTRITRNPAVTGPYIQALHKEWGLYRSLLGFQSKGMKLGEIHLGGGTPTFLAPDELKQLLGGILETIEVPEGAEFSVEADPRVTTREHLSCLAKLGFTRLSLGIQDFDPKVQEIVHRVQTEDQVREVTETARELGFTSVNYDLIYGLPLQTVHSVRDTIDAVRRLRPDRIAFYGYAHVPWIKPSHRRFTEADLPAGESKRALYELGRQMLEEVGYQEVGMDHFALTTDSLWKAAQEKRLHRNFMGYISREVHPQIGLGVSSIGDAWTVFAQNEKTLELYQERVEKGELPIHRGHILSSEDLILRRHILNLMTHLETSWNDPTAQTDYLMKATEKLRALEADGLLVLNGDHCSVTELGRACLRNICMAFDARLARSQPQTSLFSKTI